MVQAKAAALPGHGAHQNHRQRSIDPLISPSVALGFLRPLSAFPANLIQSNLLPFFVVSAGVISGQRAKVDLFYWKFAKYPELAVGNLVYLSKPAEAAIVSRPRASG